MKSITDYFQRKIKPIAENAFLKKIGVCNQESSSQIENSVCSDDLFIENNEFREEFLQYDKTSIENRNLLLIKGNWFYILISIN